jgi:biotin operon repressor
MKFTVFEKTIDLPLSTLIVAGWTGRNRDAVQHHIDELKAIGVPPPSTYPLFYRVSPELASLDAEQFFLGEQSSGEVEPLLVFDGQTFYLGTGSDHTDRGWETVSVAASKQLCPKPLASALWPLEDVQEHLDQIKLRSWVRNEPEQPWQLYQDGTLAQILPLMVLWQKSAMADQHQAGTLTIMLCGTVPTMSEIRPYHYFKFELHDPVLGRQISHMYQSHYMPIAA